MRQAFAGMLWSKQFYHYDVEKWLEGDSAQPIPPSERKKGRNNEWRHLNNADVISMPDKWEYPWYAAWDLAFHCIPLAILDAEFAKSQLVLLTAPADIHRRLRGYIGSVAVDAAGEVLAASSPKGGLVVYWDIASRRFLGTSELEDVCGLAPLRANAGFLLTSGTGAIATRSGATTTASTAPFESHWDNHVAPLLGDTA